MSNTKIQLRKSGQTGNTPADLTYGELAINYADGKLFYKNGVGIKSIQNQKTFETINANNSLVIATTPTDILNIVPGSNITISTNTTSKTITIASTASGNGGGTGITYTANTAPPTTGNVAGDQWYNTTEDILYAYLYDGTSSYWVDITSPTIVSNSATVSTSANDIIAIQGVNDSQNTSINTATNLAQAAFDKANTSANDIVTIQGVNTTQNTRITTIEGVDVTQNTNITSATNLAQAAFDKANTSTSGTYSLSGTTTGSTETEIFVGGIADTRVSVAANTTMTYDVVITGRRTDVTGSSAGFNLKGVVDNFSGTVQDVGTLYEIVIARDDASYLVDARADDANNSLAIFVTGVSGHTIKWVAKVTTVEVQQ